MLSKQIGLAALVAVLAVACATPDANAWGWRGSWGSYGSWGCYGGSWGSYGCCGGYWGRYSYGSRGCWGSYGSYGCCGGCGSCVSCGGCSACGEDATSCSTCGGAYYSDSGRRVYGAVVSSEPSPTLSRESVAVSQPPETKLTLHVPAGATITLAGAATKQGGQVRTFSTTKLSAGQTWENYEVVAEIEQNGQVYRQQRTLTLTGGQNQELSIDFPTQQLAQASR